MANLTLLTANGLIHKTGGLNWGSNILNHTTIYDAYIPIHIGTIRNNPGFFPPVSPVQTIITLNWDDGVTMTGLFEGTFIDSITGVRYPKQISSTPNKRTLGLYFRKRLGLLPTDLITLNHLHSYGRNDVDMIQTGINQYSMDFSV
jgi:hypothetical protein